VIAQPSKSNNDRHHLCELPSVFEHFHTMLCPNTQIALPFTAIAYMLFIFQYLALLAMGLEPAAASTVMNSIPGVVDVVGRRRTCVVCVKRSARCERAVGMALSRQLVVG
jgi:hypothetical protein